MYDPLFHNKKMNAANRLAAKAKNPFTTFLFSIILFLRSIMLTILGHFILFWRKKKRTN